MANNTFDMVVNLKPCRTTEKFVPFEERTYDSGWTNRSIKFNAISGPNRHMLEIRGGCWADEKKNNVMTFGANRDADGRAERLTIPWKKRFDESEIDKVADYRKFIFDMGDAYKRRKLERLLKAFDDGSVTDEMMDEAGVEDEKTAKAMLADINSERHVFITEWDFAGYVNDMLQDESIQNMRFNVRGNIETSEFNGTFYTRFIPHRILRVSDETPYKSEGTLDVVYGVNAIDSSDVVTTHEYYINAYTFAYDNRRKKQIACPVKLVLKDGTDMEEKEGRLRKLLLSNFVAKKTDGVSYKELGVKIDLINGAEIVPLTEDMLTDNELEALSLGVVTMEEIQRDRGNVVYGERKQAWVVKNFARGWLSGAKPTVYTDDNMTLYSDDDDEI